MTVTLAFKAFAKAIPCSTPFLATSDPSVLKRILAYILGLPCSSNIFPKISDGYLYGSIVTVRLRANFEAHSLTNERPVMALRDLASRTQGRNAPKADMPEPTRMTDAVEKGLRTSPNSDSGDSRDHVLGGDNDGSTVQRPSTTFHSVPARRSY